MMERIYEVCLQCMYEPVERKQPPEDQESVNYCPECGGKMTIMHIYEICPRCMDALIERKQSFKDQDSINYCPKCGHKLEEALLGNKIDDTAYKIILNDTDRLTDHMNRKNRFLKVLMKMGNLTYEEAMEKCKTKNSVIFEGDAKDIYLNLDPIRGFTPYIHYTVVPEFEYAQFATPFYSICHTCGSDTIDKEGGIFCEKCNEWLLLPPL